MDYEKPMSSAEQLAFDIRALLTNLEALKFIIKNQKSLEVLNINIAHINAQDLLRQYRETFREIENTRWESIKSEFTNEEIVELNNLLEKIEQILEELANEKE